ncbi:MAG: PilZ domain-containing protein [Planctomycetota bacterium]
MSAHERRRHPRIREGLPLRLTFGESTYDTLIVDLSVSGIHFRIPFELTLMSRVQIGLDLPAEEEHSAPIAVAGVVVRSDPVPPEGGAGNLYDTAIYFHDCSEADRSRLGRFISHRLGA